MIEFGFDALTADHCDYIQCIYIYIHVCKQYTPICFGKEMIYSVRFTAITLHFCFKIKQAIMSFKHAAY